MLWAGRGFEAGTKVRALICRTLSCAFVTRALQLLHLLAVSVLIYPLNRRVYAKSQ